MDANSRAGWATYGRCFVITLGLGFLALVGYIVAFESEDSGQWPWWAWLLLGGIAVLGAGTLLAGFFSSAHTVRRLARVGSTHEASLFITIVAAPLYWVLNFGQTRR